MKHVGREASGRSGISSPRDLATLDHRMAPRLEILLDMPAVSREVQIKHAWNQDDRWVRISGLGSLLSELLNLAYVRFA